jgi:hypothetical protein
MNNEHHEAEDFEKIITFESDQFAIVDAEVVKSLKDQIPLADKAVFIPTKQSKDVKTAFKVTAIYNDASLRRLIIEPAAANESSDHESVEESVQINGHEGDSVQKKISKIHRKTGGARPKNADRNKRNDRYSAKGDPGKALTKGKPSAEKRVEQRVQIDGARRQNYGQPRSKIESECMEFINRVKSGTISEDYLSSLDHIYEIRTALADIRDNARVKGKSFDLVYESVDIIDNHRRQNALRWIENIVMDGGLDV